MARMAIDCDGVLADFVGAFVRLYNSRRMSRRITAEDWTNWGGGGQFNRKEEKEMWKVITATPNWWLSVEALPGVGELARWMSGQSGHDIWVVTSRTETAGMTATKQTERWLQECRLNPGNNYLGVITVPDSDDKVNLVSKLDIDWIIDDKADTIEQMDRFPYLKAALLTQTWNHMATPKWRVNSVAEFLSSIA